MQAALVQLCSGTDIGANIEAASALIRKAAQDGADFIATPEMTHIVQRDSEALFKAIKPEDEDLGVQAFGALANELSINLLIGSLAIRTGENRAVNRSFLFGPDGGIRARYDKIHLFDVSVSAKETWRESRVYDRGNKAIIADIGSAKAGLSICYDLRFPNLYRHLTQKGAQLLMVPAAFTKTTGQAHWETLLRARAIETGSYVLAPAQGGVHEDGRETWGRSMIIDPWGQVVAVLEHDKPGIISAQINLGDVQQARSKIPAWQHNPEFE